MTFRAVTFRAVTLRRFRPALFALAGLAFSKRRRRRIKNNHRHPAIRRVFRCVRQPKTLVRKSAHLAHLVAPYPVLGHPSARGIRPVGGQFPITVVITWERLRIRVTFHRQTIRQFTHFIGKQRQHLAPEFRRRRASGFKKGAVTTLDQFHAKAFARNRDPHIFFDLLESAHVLNRLFQLFFQFRHLGFVDRQTFATDTAKPVADVLAFAGGIGEIPAHRLLHLFAAAKEPQHNKQRHHGRNEIGVSHFPGPAVVSTVAGYLFPDDDNRLYNLSSHRFPLRLRPATGFFHRLELRPAIVRDRAPRKLNRNNRCHPFREGH